MKESQSKSNFKSQNSKQKKKKVKKVATSSYFDYYDDIKHGSTKKVDW